MRVALAAGHGGRWRKLSKWRGIRSKSVACARDTAENFLHSEIGRVSTSDHYFRQIAYADDVNDRSVHAPGLRYRVDLDFFSQAFLLSLQILNSRLQIVFTNETKRGFRKSVSYFMLMIS